MQDDKTRLRDASEVDAARETGAVPNPALIRIPGVRLGRLLGEGGMASVYEGEDLGFTPPRRVAVKLMDPALSTDPEFRARFAREASLVAEFRHDNIVHVYASGEVDGAKYLVMEYLPGGTLAERLQRGRMEVREVLTIAASLADALGYSHERGIIHRDFKPGNVMFTAEAKPVLTDFGVAKTTSADETALTRFASVIGAPRYMAPEQEHGDEVMASADIYAFGLTTFEMLTGDLPPARLRSLRSPDDASLLAPALGNVSFGIGKLIARCLQLDPALRPTAQECRDVLAAATVVGSTGAPQDRGDRPRRSWVGAIAATAAVLLVAGAVVAYRQLAAPGTVDAPATPPVDATPDARGASPPTGTLNVNLQPATATLLINGLSSHGGQLTLPAGRYPALAVAPQHYGQRQLVDVAASTEHSLTINLAPTRLPTVHEYDAFLALADAPQLAAEQLAEISEPTLHQALELKLLGQQSDGTADALAEQISEMSQAGDARSSVVQVLASAARSGRISQGLLTPQVEVASEDGDALASLVVALAHRDALSSAGTVLASDNPKYLEYCTRMRLVSSQGWAEVGDRYLRQDHCPR